MNLKSFLRTVICFTIIGLVSHTLFAQSGKQKTIISEKSSNEELSVSEVSAKLSGAAFVTAHLEESVRFYTDYLGFRESKRMIIDSPAGLAPFGVSGSQKLEYVALVPAAFSKDNPNFPGLNFIHIEGAEANPFNQNPERAPIFGEIMKAYAVKGLAEIEKRMRKANVPIITPLAPSATGKSQTLTVIDPNGVRLQMYEYIK